MAKQTATSKRMTLWIDKEIKEKGDEIIYNLGLKPSTVINLMYRQIINQREIPFKITMPEILTPRSKLYEHAMKGYKK